MLQRDTIGMNFEVVVADFDDHIYAVRNGQFDLDGLKRSVWMQLDFLDISLRCSKGIIEVTETFPKSCTA